MLLVTFHGGSEGITNVYAYDTTTGQLNTASALQSAPLSGAELRGMVYTAFNEDSYLYVVNGAKGTSTIICFDPPAPGSSVYDFSYVGEFLGPSLSKKGHFENSIGHPYAMVFNGTTLCYVSNQDTNVVAQAQVNSYSHASIEKGCQSAYLNGLTSICPSGGCVYLDGTYVASQDGALPDVDVTATNVPSQYGGLSVSFSEDKGKQEVQNSVRDVAISGGVLFVCDEPSNLIRLYSLTDGSYLGCGPTLPKSPTHLSVQPSGLYVSADDQIFWSALPSSPTPSGLCFTSVLSATSINSNYKVGGITFNGSTAYVAFQDGTGTTGTGAIYSYNVQVPPQSAPVFGTGTPFASGFPDTPEFVLFVNL